MKCFSHFYIRTHIENKNVCQFTEENESDYFQPEEWARILATPGPVSPESEKTNISAQQMRVFVLLALHFF